MGDEVNLKRGAVSPFVWAVCFLAVSATLGLWFIAELERLRSVTAP